MGHREGAKKFREIASYCQEIGIKYLTVYAFSTENWKRPKEEVDAIMQLFHDYLIEARQELRTRNIHIPVSYTHLEHLGMEFPAASAAQLSLDGETSR